MKLFVPIDLKSVRKNPDAGSTSSTLSSPMEIAFTFPGGLPEKYMDPKRKDMMIMNKSIVVSDKGERIVDVSGVIFDPDLALKFVELGAKVNVKNDVRTFHHLPIPSHSFEFEDITVVCEHCNEPKKLSDLESDYYDSDDEVIYMEDVCPSCGVADCVSLEYESLESALRRIKIRGASPTMKKCIQKAMEHPQLIRYRGGFWSAPGLEVDRYGAPEWHFETRTIAALIDRNIFEVVQYARGSIAKYPVKVKFNNGK
jgi:hypothetical protein